MSNAYQVVIGLEVHVQLITATKIFCRCATAYGQQPNSQTCPVCLGLPGALPVLNQQAVGNAMLIGLAANCQIAERSIFARKNYFYPDLPKGYQISQYNLPLCQHGYLDIAPENGEAKRVGITRMHMEEDAGKLMHGETPAQAHNSYMDLNRTGTPLLEIVSEPDMRSAEEAVAYLKQLHQLVVYLGVCDGNMEEGSFRCDANVSVRPRGQQEFGTRAELKNINSFRFVKQAIEYEVERQIDVIEDGGQVVQETRLFDSQQGVTRSMRTKEEAHDYRYFPDPDLVPLEVNEAWQDQVRARLPELPQAKQQRFQQQLGLSAYDASVLAAERPLAEYFEATQAVHSDGKACANWIMGELLGACNNDGLPVTEAKVNPQQLAGLLDRIADGTISGKIGKKVFAQMWEKGQSADEVIEAQGLKQVTDTSAIEAMVDEVLAANPQQVEQFKAGKEKVMGFLVGQVMKASQGKANPQKVNELLRQKLTGEG